MKIYSVDEPHLQVDAKSDMKIYAVSGDVPEAWGKENILCVRWEPEDVSVDADKYTLNVYKWLERKPRNIKIRPRQSASVTTRQQKQACRRRPV